MPSTIADLGDVGPNVRPHRISGNLSTRHDHSDHGGQNGVHAAFDDEGVDLRLLRVKVSPGRILREYDNDAASHRSFGSFTALFQERISPDVDHAAR